MGNAGRGVEVRDTSIRITFRHKGKAYKKTVKTAGVPIPPTPANIKYAMRLAEEIKAKIKFGTLNVADYFDDEGDTGSVVTLEQRLRLWLKLQTLATSTKRTYGFIVEWWISELGNKPIAALVHSDILGALANAPHRTGKTTNNTVSVLRNALDLAIRDGVIKVSPLEGLEAASHQTPEPDPFSDEERESILCEMARSFDPQIENYFGFKFFTGVRTGESLAIRPLPPGRWGTRSRCFYAPMPAGLMETKTLLKCGNLNPKSQGTFQGTSSEIRSKQEQYTDASTE